MTDIIDDNIVGVETNENSMENMDPKISYPLKVYYCGECTMPIEYCEYSGKSEKCKQWLEKNLPELMDKVLLDDDEGKNSDDKKHQKRGGKGSRPDKPVVVKESKDKPKITIKRTSRSKNKFVTIIKGLNTFGIDLKVAAKFFSSRFACGSSVTGIDEIVIQGDVVDDLIDVIQEKWKQIDEDSIEDLDDQK